MINSIYRPALEDLEDQKTKISNSINIFGKF